MPRPPHRPLEVEGGAGFPAPPVTTAGVAGGSVAMAGAIGISLCGREIGLSFGNSAAGLDVGHLLLGEQLCVGVASVGQVAFLF